MFLFQKEHFPIKIALFKKQNFVSKIRNKIFQTK